MLAELRNERESIEQAIMAGTHCSWARKTSWKATSMDVPGEETRAPTRKQEQAQRTIAHAIKVANYTSCLSLLFSACSPGLFPTPSSQDRNRLTLTVWDISGS
jgi:hypothetical protein